MTLGTATMVAQISSHAAALGVFDTVQGHEVKSPPGPGLTCAVWAQYLGPAAGMSGLNATTARLTFTIRVYTSALTEPADLIDPAVMDAVDLLISAYSAHFTLGGLVKNVVLLADGTGEGLSAQAGYMQIGQGLQRIVDITLPVIINDLWVQTP